MRIFIQSFEAISPIESFANSSVSLEKPQAVDGYLKCSEPDYKTYINPKLLRRMSRVIKMGVSTANQALTKSGIAQPDAILMGTGLGCVDDTITFLNQLTENQESLLNPTAFIQSTHNTVSGQIALMLECKSYNLTFTQQQLSFETVLLEGLMMLEEKANQHILVGSLDEMTPQLAQLLVQNGCAETSTTTGYTPGEGAAFFMLSDKGQKADPSIIGFEIRHDLLTTDDRANAIGTFLEKCGIQIDSLGLILNGANGSSMDKHDDYLNKEQFANIQSIAFKNYCGEHDSATAFAMWLACAVSTKAINNIEIPDHQPYILIHNRAKNGGDVLILIQK
jgi:3-oxoacyl-(acyl-carrier-protein) synthase